MSRYQHLRHTSEVINKTEDLMKAFEEAAKEKFGEGVVTTFGNTVSVGGWTFEPMFTSDYTRKLKGVSGHTYANGTKTTRAMIKKDGSISFDKVLDRVKEFMEMQQAEKKQVEEAEERKASNLRHLVETTPVEFAVDSLYGSDYKVTDNVSQTSCKVSVSSRGMEVSGRHMKVDVAKDQVWGAVRLVLQTEAEIRVLTGA